MTRTVFPNAMVAHVWAQQTQYEGRSHNGNFYFRDSTLYSYGSHWVVGRFTRNAGGDRAILLNSRTYSISTSGHRRYAESAVRDLGLPVFRVPGASLDHEANLAAFVKDASELALQSKRARDQWRKGWAAESAENRLNEAAAYAEFFGVDFQTANVAELAEAAALAAREASAAMRKRKEDQRQVDREAFEEWKRGERAYCPHSYATDANGSVYMRVNGDQLQTSRGASVPLRHAIRVFQFIRQCRESGEGFKANGRIIRVGHFTVTSISPKGDMVAGCHTFTWERIAEAAKAAGAFDAPPSAEAVEVRA